ncbi:MAG: hypothetical protein ACXVAX_11400 [Pseudobdellovibrio sp.]
MKTNNLTKLFKGLFVAAALASSVVACGSKNNNNQNLNAYQQSCSNCQNITGYPFFTVSAIAYNQVYYSNSLKMNLNFSGQNVSQANNNNNGYGYYSPPSMQYSGQVGAVGDVTVSAPINFGNCPQVPAGDYTISTQTVGTWNGNGSQAQISGLRLVTTNGPVTFTMVFTNASAVEYAMSYSSSTRLYGNVQIDTVNGLNCFGTQYYMY